MNAMKTRLDTALGKLTMYRLVLWVLAVLAVYSMVLNLLGWLTFGLPEMLAHLGLCLGLTYGSNSLMAKLFKVHPHSESSLITGLLLYFLFWPTELNPSMRVSDVAGIALACLLATASKYVLAFRGRHILNPAAAGAFITGLTGLNIATWWAATPAMLWLLVPGVVLVVRRTRKSLMAAVFMFTSTMIIVIQLLPTVADPGAALWQTLAQRPLLFFVGFMLTEPLTLPPRRRQQLALAVVVAVLFAVPYHLGVIANSPELALLVGNFVAFLLGQRGAVLLTFTGSRPLSTSATEFRFKPGRPVRHAPGQFIELHLPHRRSDGKGQRRVFSITSAPGSPEVKVGVGTAGPVSAAKQSLLALEPGDVVSATAIGGDFLPPHNPDTPVLLIAAGIGITPFMAHLAQASDGKRDAVLLYLARSNTELSYSPELEAASARIIARTSDGSAPAPFMENAGPHRIDHRRLRDLVPDITARDVYISGSPSAVSFLRTAARTAGAKRIQTDSFAGY